MTAPTVVIPTKNPNTSSVGKPKMDITQIYSPISIDPTFTILLMGEWGSGKTRLLGTAPLPLLIYAFDPKGIVVLHKVYPELIKEGLIQYIPLWGDDPTKPTKYMEWERIWETHIASGYLDQFGTVAIDSFTTWLNCAGAKWLQLKNEQRTNKGGKGIDALAQGDYPGLYNLVQKMIGKTSACDTNFILTAHLEAEKNELDGSIRYVLSTFKGLKVIIPPLFSEKWVMMKQARVGGKPDHYILTNNSGMYQASTQIGADTFETKEIPNIKGLLEKAGFATEDKPKFWENESIVLH